MADNVNHPSHYNSGQFECIEIMRVIFGEAMVKAFCVLNAFKYIWRMNKKNGLEDAKKCRWYIDKYIELSESEENG